MSSLVLVICLIVICWPSFNEGKQLTKTLTLVEDCQRDEFFDITSLDCKKCGLEAGDYFKASFSSSSSSVNSIKADNQSLTGSIRSPDGFDCICGPGLYKVNQEKGQQCHVCPSGSITSFDGYHCSLCGAGINFTTTSKQCSPCPENSVMDEKAIKERISEEPQLERYCKPCPQGLRPDGENKECIVCHSSLKNCSCPKDHYTLYGGICIPNGNLLTEKVNLYQVKYDNEEEVNSAFYMETLQAAVYNCQYHGNRTACQILANLCTLLNYNIHEGSGKTGTINACTEYSRLAKLPVVPMLVYGDSGTNELRKGNVIGKSYKIDSKLEFIAARYNGAGVLVDYSPLKLGELQLCKSEPESLESGFYFGTNYHQKCEIDVRDLWDSSASQTNDLLFYDLYLLDDDQDPDVIYPIPVLVTNLVENGEPVNRGDDEQKWRLVRRFYLTEALVGIELKKDIKSQEGPDKTRSVPQSNEIDEPTTSNYFRYAQSITINVKISKNDGSGSVYPPWLKVTYGLATKEDYVNHARVPVEFKVIYSMDQAKPSRDLSICLGVFCGLAVLFALFRVWVWSKRQGKQAFDPATVSEFLVFSAGFLADAFFLVSIGFSIHWFIIYKQQSVIHGLLPTSSQESTVRVYLYLAFALKCIRILHDLIILSRTNVFLIDWERPRVITVAKKSRTEEEKKSQEEPLSSAVTGSSAKKTSIAGSGLGITGKIGQDKIHFAHCPAVSIWRTYFVANEWIKLCTHRRIKTSLHLFLVLMLLHSFGLKNLATSDTQNNLKLEASQRFVPESDTCRLAIGSLVYFLLCIAQLVWGRVIYERMYRDKLDEFVDLCSVSNVSLFCLLYHRFGYYIHGRSPNGRADVNMKEMHELLKREEDDLCSKRGLLPNTDQQTFQMLLPSTINDQCRRIRALLTTYSQGAERMQGVGGHLFKVDLEKVVPTFVMLTKFLSGFIEHAFKDADYTVKDKSNPELILDFELAEPRERGFLYQDNGHSFDALLFSGNEFTLLTFELMLFIFIDLLSHSFIISVIVTFLVIEIIKKLYTVAYKRNIVRKALIDERFLM